MIYVSYFDEFKWRKGRHKPSGDIDMEKYLGQQDVRQIVRLPSLVNRIHWDTGICAEFIKEKIVEYRERNQQTHYFSRTTTIFITGNTRGGRVEKNRLKPYLKHNGAFISHIHIRAKQKPKRVRANG